MDSILISRITRADAIDLISTNRANQDYHLPWVTSLTDKAGFDMWFARCLTGANGGLVARARTSRQVVGVFNINEIVAGACQSAYLGYYGMSGFSRKGLMTQGLRAVVHYAFNDLGLHRLEANIQPGNEASIALLRRCGFQKEGFSPRYLLLNGEWRDHERWALRSDMRNLVGLDSPALAAGWRGMRVSGTSSRRATSGSTTAHKAVINRYANCTTTASTRSCAIHSKLVRQHVDYYAYMQLYRPHAVRHHQIDSCGHEATRAGEPLLAKLGQLHHYHQRAFLTPPSPEVYVQDSELRHNLEDAAEEYSRLVEAHPALGYEVSILPMVAVAERADFVLRTLQE